MEQRQAEIRPTIDKAVQKRAEQHKKSKEAPKKELPKKTRERLLQAGMELQNKKGRRALEILSTPPPSSSGSAEKPKIKSELELLRETMDAIRKVTVPKSAEQPKSEIKTSIRVEASEKPIITNNLPNKAEKPAEPAVELDFVSRRNKALQERGFIVKNELGNGLTSEVFRVEETDQSNPRNLVAKMNVEDDPTNASRFLIGEYGFLQNLKSVQENAGFSPQELYTPEPVTFVNDGNVRGIIMSEAPGEDCNNVGGSLSTENSLSVAIQSSHLFSILENTDPVRKGDFLSMKDFQAGKNIFVDVNTKGEPKITVLDWSLKVNEEELPSSRSGERLKITQMLTKLLLGQDSLVRLGNHNENPKEVEFAIDINKLVNNQKFKDLDPSLKHIILKGFGVLKVFPGGYSSHTEMLNDLLASGKKLGVPETKVPRLLRDTFKSIKLINAKFSSVEDLNLPEIPTKPPINREASKTISSFINYPDSISGEILSGLDERVEVNKYTGKELAQFLSTCTASDFDFLSFSPGVDKQAEINKRILMARTMASTYYLKSMFSPETNYRDNDRSYLATVVKVKEENPNWQEDSDNFLPKLIKKQGEYWNENKGKISELTTLNADEIDMVNGFMGNLQLEFP